MKQVKHLSLLIAAVLMSATMACSRGGPEPTGDVVADAVITAKVKAALVKEPALKSSDIKVETKSGAVQLSGSANTKTEADRAAEVAKQIDGVREVKNDLMVKAT